jgi:glycosyltransferase involved in cell wall biosynthesis
LLEIEWRKMRRAEARVVREADAAVAVSDTDRELFAEQSEPEHVTVIPTGVDAEYFAPHGVPEIPNRLVFSGSMDWYPNEDAIVYFAEHVWPILRAARPSVSLTVVGRHPSARLAALAKTAGITLTGTVDDVRPFVDEAAVYVVPLRVGGGTRLKILEALAMGKPVVSTTVGAEGLTLVPGRHYLVADGAEAFARTVLDLLDAPAVRASLGQAGRRLVEERHSWDRVAADFERSLDWAVRHRQLSEHYAERRIAVSPR